MPKSAKKRKDKAADFAKAKLKLGKGKQAPSNAIDTSFKARSIALPNQSIAVEKDQSIPTTRRQQTFGNLISHLKHHNAGTRRDAVCGLRELLEENPDLVDDVLPTLINSVVRLIGDEDSTVREAILSLLSWLLPRIPTKDILPHSSLLLLYTTSAQTHISPEIRVDAVRFLNMFLEYFPEVVVLGWDTYANGHGSRILAGYLGILNAGTIYNDVDTPTATSTASVMLTPQSKLVVLQSLSLFLNIAMQRNRGDAGPSQETDYRFLSSSFTDLNSYLAFDNSLKGGHLPSLIWKPSAREGEEAFIGNFPFDSTNSIPWDLDDLTENISVSEASDTLATSLVFKLATALHPTLTSTFLDFSATVFSPSSPPPEIDLNLMQAVVEIARALYVFLLGASCSSAPSICVEELSAILNYMAPYFPFTTSGRRDIKVEQALQDLNLHYCDMVSHLVLATQANQSSTSTRKARSNLSKKNLDDQMERVREYVLQVLGNGNQLNPRILTHTVYTSLLPTIWSFLGVTHPSKERGEEERATVFQVALEHATKLSSKSALKGSSSDFIARLILLETEPHYHGTFRIPHRPADDRLVEEWVAHLPKVLWEMGSSNVPASESILLFLIRALQRRVSQVMDTRTLSLLRARLVPFFVFTHAERGQVAGPYTKLPPFSFSGTCVRRLALSMVATLLAVSKSQQNSEPHLADAVNTALTQNAAEKKYWMKLSLSVLHP
uniref:Pre-rRNA-processing protein n=1 Tax=Moniliophthora roreri TaxID=221103 RepID=A0A0W0G2M8_MONRR